MESIIDAIIALKKQFNIQNLENYQSLLLIIYNTMFLDEDQLTPRLKYELFSLLDFVIQQINLNKQNPISNNSSWNLYPLLVFDKIAEINERKINNGNKS